MKILTAILISLMHVYPSHALKIDIPSYPENAVIPNDYTSSSGACNGDDVIPQIIWSEIPQNTQSFALIFQDVTNDVLHWKMYNIEADVRHIPENNLINVGTRGLNDFGFNGYRGPCPLSPTADSYQMTLYALNTTFESEPTLAMIQNASIQAASYSANRAANDDQQRYEYIAEYQVTFEANWSAMTHPVDYPDFAHFSFLVGGTHRNPGLIWQENGYASDGMEEIAESGGTIILSFEIDDFIAEAKAESRILGSPVTGVDSTTMDFIISESHPYFSLVTMIAPSPDWIVGVNGITLWDDGQWVDQLTVDLLPYDAGTQDGDSFENIGGDTQPRQPITRITDPPLANNVPLGQFVFELISSEGVSNEIIYAQGFE